MLHLGSRCELSQVIEAGAFGADRKVANTSDGNNFHRVPTSHGAGATHKNVQVSTVKVLRREEGDGETAPAIGL